MSLGCFGNKRKLLIWFAGTTASYDSSLSLRLQMTLADQHYHNHPNRAALWIISIFAALQEQIKYFILLNRVQAAGALSEH